MRFTSTMLAAGLAATAWSQSLGSVLSGLNGMTTSVDRIIVLTPTINVGNGNQVILPSANALKGLTKEIETVTASLKGLKKRDGDLIGSPSSEALVTRDLSGADQTQLTDAFGKFASRYSVAMAGFVNKKPDVVLPPIIAQVEKILAAEQAVVAVFTASLLAAAPKSAPMATSYKQLTESSIAHAVAAYAA